MLTPPDVYDPLMYRLITFPLITIAAVNGHGTYAALRLCIGDETKH